MDLSFGKFSGMSIVFRSCVNIVATVCVIVIHGIDKENMADLCVELSFIPFGACLYSNGGNILHLTELVLSACLVAIGIVVPIIRVVEHVEIDFYVMLMIHTLAVYGFGRLLNWIKPE